MHQNEVVYNKIMKLNADIIHKALKETYAVTIEGERSKELCLSRPEFYMEDERCFQSGHLYLATVEHLPHRPDIRSGAVLVCIGEGIHLRYYRERLCLITTRCSYTVLREWVRLTLSLLLQTR